MDARSENLFRDMFDAKIFALSLETKVGLKGRTFRFERRNYVHNGTR